MRMPVLLLIMILMVTLSLSAPHVLQVNMPCPVSYTHLTLPTTELV